MDQPQDTRPEAIQAILRAQRDTFASGATRDVPFRLRQLRALEDRLRRSEAAILEALRADLGKAPMEAFASEVGLVIEEVKHIRKHLPGWARPRRVPGHWVQFPSSSWVYPEPRGVALIIGPWNYPFLLIMAPLIGALAAGDCAVLKPSELSPHTSRMLAGLVRDTLDPGLACVVEGGAATAQALLDEKFDVLFYTGGVAAGRIVMQAAARHLTPVTLELGGKSPTLVDANLGGPAGLRAAARRIMWGKFGNAGQTCIGPDYVLADRRVKDDLLDAFQRALRDFYGDDPRRSPDYGRIISARHFERLRGLMEAGRVLHGGQMDAAERYIAPTLLEAAPDSPLMQEEIFGPLLPVLEYGSLDEAIAFVNARPKPLALYFFSADRAAQARVLRETSSGGGCINDIFMHYATPALPFGGVGDSGIGRYRGRYSFETFSHFKGITRQSLRIDLPQRYAPYKDRLRLLRKLI
jgi:acyl-CoA reductase-like NAD-dependent aldehyde dehydrogenase